MTQLAPTVPHNSLKVLRPLRPKNNAHTTQVVRICSDFRLAPEPLTLFPGVGFLHWRVSKRGTLQNGWLPVGSNFVAIPYRYAKEGQLPSCFLVVWSLAAWRSSRVALYKNQGFKPNQPSHKFKGISEKGASKKRTTQHPHHPAHST